MGGGAVEELVAVLGRGVATVAGTNLPMAKTVAHSSAIF